MSEIIITAVISSLSSVVIAGIIFWLTSMKNWITHEELDKKLIDVAKHTAFSEERGAIFERLNNLEDNHDKMSLLNIKLVDSLNELRTELAKLRVILNMLDKKLETE